MADVSAVDLKGASSIDALAAKLSGTRVVFIGETHDRYDHHQNQFALIQALQRAQPGFAVGMEYFQRSAQASLDKYVAGGLEERAFLRESGYYDSWSFDYRMYAPILRFAREQRIPLIALNVPTGLTSLIAKTGIADLRTPWRQEVPKELGPTPDAYRARLRESFEQHQDKRPDAFEHFVEAQLVWDEGMAETAATYLNGKTGSRMVVLAGSGHMVFGDGIPDRLKRRTGASYAVVLSNGDDVEARMGDYLLLSSPQELPPAGILGVKLHDGNVGCSVGDLVAGGAADSAGLKKDDLFVDIDGTAVHTAAEVKASLWDKSPGEHAKVRVLRGSDMVSVDVTLKAAK